MKIKLKKNFVTILGQYKFQLYHNNKSYKHNNHYNRQNLIRFRNNQIKINNFNEQYNFKRNHKKIKV